MIKITNCKQLNPFDQLETIWKFENIRLNQILAKYENKTIQAINKNNPNCYIIIHRSTKEQNRIQCSYFDKAGAYMDIIRDTYKDIFKEIYYLFNYKVVEVI